MKLFGGEPWPSVDAALGCDTAIVMGFGVNRR